MLWHTRKDAGRTWIRRLGGGANLTIGDIKRYFVASVARLSDGIRLKINLLAKLKKTNPHSLRKAINAMSEPVWIVEWHRYTEDTGAEKWSSMTFATEEKATAFASLIGETESDCVVLIQDYDGSEETLIVKTSPRHATIFALVTWVNDSKTIHWNLPNDIIALWMTLDKFGDVTDAKRIQVCEADKDGDLDMSDIAESLVDFKFGINLSGEDDEEVQ